MYWSNWSTKVIFPVYLKWQKLETLEVTAITIHAQNASKNLHFQVQIHQNTFHDF